MQPFPWKSLKTVKIHGVRHLPVVCGCVSFYSSQLILEDKCVFVDRIVLKGEILITCVTLS